jgi:hypothetical protein
MRDAGDERARPQRPQLVDFGRRGGGDHKCHHLAFGCLSSASYGLLVDVRVMCSGADVHVSVSGVVLSPRSLALVATICSV